MMRVITIVVVLLLAAPGLFAQDALLKGAMEIDGSFSFTSSSGDLYENAAGDGISNLSFAPSVGYFMMDNLSVGGLINFNSWSQGDDKSSGFLFGPEATYYLAEMGPGHPFAKLAYIYGSHKTDFGGEVEWSTSELQLGVGYLVWLNDYIGLSTLLGYSMDSNTPDGGDAVEGSSFGLSVGLAMYYF